MNQLANASTKFTISKLACSSLVLTLFFCLFVSSKEPFTGPAEFIEQSLYWAPLLIIVPLFSLLCFCFWKSKRQFILLSDYGRKCYKIICFLSLISSLIIFLYFISIYYNASNYVFYSTTGFKQIDSVERVLRDFSIISVITITSFVAALHVLGINKNHNLCNLCGYELIDSLCPECGYLK